LPVVDELSVEYADQVRFIGVAGRADLDRTTARAQELVSNLEWGLDDSIWELYGVPYQPVTFLVTADGRIFERFDGAPYAPDELRERVEALLSG
jgi:hypothetical protein